MNKGTLMRRIATLAAAAALAVSSMVLGPSTPAEAGGPVCQPTWTIGVGGFQIVWAIPPNTGQDSTYLPVDQPAGYNSLSISAGVVELDRLFRQYRSQCPGSHIKMIGHSGGAAVVHVWVSQNRYEPNATAVLLADPKRAAGPGGAGIAAHPLAEPLSSLGVFAGVGGADADFGPFPVLSVCNAGDWVCNRSAGLHGYLFTGVHARYNPDPDDYPNFSRGVWYLNEY